MFRSVIISLFITSAALAETWTVDDDGPADFENIQAAIDAASDGDEIVVMPGTYTGTNIEVINPLGKLITIRSSAGPEVTIIDAEGARRGVTFETGEGPDTIIEGFTITGGTGGPQGNYGGGINCSNSSPTIKDCIIEDNYSISGGGIYCNGNTDHEANPIIIGCIIRNNVASSGGGIYLGNNSNPSLTDCLIESNATDWGYGRGGGIYCYGNNTPTLTGCTVSGNSCSSGANDSGPGIYCGGSSPVLTDTLVCGNLPAAFQIWGVEDWVDNGGNCVVSSCDDIDGNDIPDACDAIADGILEVPSEFATIQGGIDAAVDGNIVLVGPGTYTGTNIEVINPLGKLITIRSSAGPEVTIIDAEGARRGVTFETGEGPDTIIEGFTITGGTGGPQGNYGGGVNCSNSSSPTIKDCIIEDNYSISGGGIYCNGNTDHEANPIIIGCIIRNNVASSGGGIYLGNNSNPSLTDCLIENNATNWFYGTGGGIYCSCKQHTDID